MTKKIIIYHAQFITDKCKKDLNFARELVQMLPVDKPGDLEFTLGELEKIELSIVDWFKKQIELQNNLFDGLYPLDVESVLLRNSVLRGEANRTGWVLNKEIIEVHQRITRDRGWGKNVRCLCDFNIPTAVLLALQDLRRCLFLYMKIFLNHSQNLSTIFQRVYDSGLRYIVDNSLGPVTVNRVVHQIQFQ